MRFKDRLRGLGYDDYSSYLRSRHWAQVKKAYRSSALEQVCKCGEETVELHHRTYDRLGAEHLADLVPLCQRCHALIHQLEREGRIDLALEGFFSPERAMAWKRPPAGPTRLQRRREMRARVRGQAA